MNQYIQNATKMDFLSWLTLLFIGLKLTDQINWSWWWVTCPIWISIVAVIFFSIITVIIGAIASK